MQIWSAPLIDVPGIPDVKQVELYHKHEPLIPDAFHPLPCLKPDDETINKVKEQ